MFFDATPDFFYPDFKEPGKVKLSKNLFRRIRTRDSFNAVYATSTPYTITGGETIQMSTVPRKHDAIFSLEALVSYFGLWICIGGHT